MTVPNDQAFPLEKDGTVQGKGKIRLWTPGLTKREFFAGKALEGMIAGSQGIQITTAQFASQAVELADALITELNK